MPAAIDMGTHQESKFFVGDYRQVPKYRILSLDGGGIYGLNEALMLKELCRRDKRFLSRGNIFLFAGSSAGALNCLLMAKYDRPRDAIESGELEQFWLNPLAWVNSDPFGSWLSLLGLAPWFSEREAFRLFEDHFGQLTLGDLKQNVLIATFAWAGEELLPGLDSPWTQGDELMRGYRGNHRTPFGSMIAPPLTQPSEQLKDHYQRNRNSWVNYDDPDPIALKSATGFQPENFRTDAYRRWQPQLFTHFRSSKRTDPYRDARVVDVAYAASNLPGFRKMRYGLGDGGIFNVNPAPYAYAHLVQYLRWNEFNLAAAPGLMPHTSAKGTSKNWNVSEELLANIRLGMIGRSAISMLSVGDGSTIPYLWPPSFGLGLGSLFTRAVNPMRGIFYPPFLYATQATNEAANGIMRELMGWNFCRLNPPILELPTLLAAILSRSQRFRRYIVSRMRQSTRSRPVQEALDLATRFMAHPYLWAEDRIWLPVPALSVTDPRLETLLETYLGDNSGSTGVFEPRARPEADALDPPSPLPLDWGSVPPVQRST